MAQWSELILASTSSARRALMDSLGVTYRAVAPGVDEDVAPGTSTEEAVRILALRKARAVLQRFPSALIIASDQLVSVDGRALGKPVDARAATAQLTSLCGRSHDIFTSVCVLDAAEETTEVDSARLHVWPLSEVEVDAYVATSEWEGCAGGYRIEGRGQALFERIEGDRTAIQGLPMQRVVRLLRSRGWKVW